MATDLTRLVVSLEAKVEKFAKAMDRANGVANKRARSIETRFEKMNKKLGSGFTLLGGKIAGAFAVAGGLRGAQQLIDAATRIDNALKTAGLSGAELTKVYDALFASAQRNATPLQSLVELYGRASLSADELGISQEQLLSFTDKIAVALRVSGQSAEESSGALLQLAQLLGAGTVRAEEFSSVQEGALPILQAVAAGLEEAGGSVAKLRKLVVDGKVSSKAFFMAFEAGAGILDEKVAGATFTVAQGFERVYNALINAAGKMDDGSEASKNLSDALEALASSISSFDVSIISNELGAMSRDIAATIDDWDRWVAAYNRVKAAVGNGDLSGAVSAAGGFLMPSEGPSNVKVAGGKGPRKPAGIELTVTKGNRERVSIKDAPASGSGGGGGGRTRQNDYQRESAQILERTAALKAETAAMAGLNPLVNDYGYAVEKARAVVELENAATAAKLKLTPELKASIDALAEGYAQASVEAEKLAESQDRVQEAASELRDTAKDVFSGFISDMRSGKSAAEALQGALDKVLNKLIEIGINAIFGGGFGSGLGGGGAFGGAVFTLNFRSAR